MTSNAFGRWMGRVLALGLLTLVASVGATSIAADARAVEDAQARSTLTVRSSQFGAVLFDGSGRALRLHP